MVSRFLTAAGLSAALAVGSCTPIKKDGAEDASVNSGAESRTRSGAPADAVPPDAAPPGPAEEGMPPLSTAPPLEASISFESGVRPILESRCRPCHFPGGTLYAKLPFDRPETVRLLGERLFTRIQKEEERALIRAFLAQPAGPSDAPSPAGSGAATRGDRGGL